MWDAYRVPSILDRHGSSGALLHTEQSSRRGYCSARTWFIGPCKFAFEILPDERGEFGDPIDNTRGILLRWHQYSYVELFDVTGEEG